MHANNLPGVPNQDYVYSIPFISLWVLMVKYTRQTQPDLCSPPLNHLVHGQTNLLKAWSDQLRGGEAYARSACCDVASTWPPSRSFITKPDETYFGFQTTRASSNVDFNDNYGTDVTWRNPKSSSLLTPWPEFWVKTRLAELTVRRDQVVAQRSNAACKAKGLKTKSKTWRGSFSWHHLKINNHLNMFERQIYKNMNSPTHYRLFNSIWDNGRLLLV